MITAEQRKNQAETAALAALVPQLDKKQLICLVSTLVRVEVLDADLTPQQKNVFTSLLSRKSLIQIKEPSVPIMDLASELRSYYKEQKKQNPLSPKTPSTPDAIHLATAIHYECDFFYTLDEKDKPDSCGLLKLQSPIAGKYLLQIVKPQAIQMGLSV